MYERNGKRLFDLIFSTIGLIVCLPLFAVVAVLIKMESAGAVFFQQERIGKGRKVFKILKFRTMVEDKEGIKHQFNPGDDGRITRVGYFLRRLKIDEFPELINVIKGQMSFVGPRPEVPKYLSYYSGVNGDILQVRPGITDYASMKYRDEFTILAQSQDPELLYTSKILPDKLNINLKYIQNITLLQDLKIILLTVFKILWPNKQLSACEDFHKAISD